ncbi:WD40-like Beta Propeller Repeat [Lutibacter agarilyticus]|uniref:WD40-like Beta Propeller Repeat n=1 Tax=Lutibacter agarilyticus TaxID=1109740 RepID=A0A238VIH7_9FLAO|nr:OmpA family protein [Lutibacter agarilyticus]SNR33299.1 WD40-like Beta Propeller Repeat [Lutibacter agarilyticus]
MNKIGWLFLIITISTLKAQETKIEVFNTSINSVYAELGISYLDDATILFASSKKVDKDKNFSNKRTRNNSQLHLEMYVGSVTNDGDIIQTARFSKNTNNPILEGDITFTPDKKTVYFTWNNFYNTQSRKDSAKWKTLHIVKAVINENLEISNIEVLPFNHKKYDVRSPEVSKDGKQLFFTSNKEDSYGEFDMYVVDILPNNTFSEPINLGSKVNTRESEFFPFVDQNNNLYFSSYGHKGLGGLDIFKSEFKDGTYQTPVALKAPINSEYDDFWYVENQQGNAGFFTSNRKESIGDVDIFSVKYIEKQCLSNFIVRVLHKESKLDLEDVPVSIFENNTLIKKLIINPNSKEEIALKCDTTYKIIATKDGFESNELVFLSDNILNKTNDLTINLTPIECAQTITGIVLNKETNEPVLNAKVSLYTENKLIESIVTSTENKFSFPIQCETAYKIMVENEAFIASEEMFTSDKTLSKTNDLTINLTPIECTQTITGIVLNKETNQPVLNAKVSLYTENQLIESIVTSTENKFSFPIQCETAYKIMVENEQFMTSEEMFTSDKTLSKTNDLTINLTPIECTQTITGIVLNKETNQPVLNAKVSLFSDNKLIESIVTSTENKFSFPIHCETAYKIMVENEAFIASEEMFTSDKTLSKTNDLTINLTPIECTQTITGIVLNKETNEPVLNAKVSLFFENQLIESIVTSTENKFSFPIQCETAYKIMVENEAFIASEEMLTSDKTLSKTNDLTINLTPIECTQTITGIVLNKETNEPVLNAKVSLFFENQLIESIVTSTENKFSFPIQCETAYKIMVENEQFMTSEEMFTSDKTLSKTNDLTINLTPIECTQTITGIILNKETNEPVLNAKVSLYSKNKFVETQFTANGRGYKFTIDCNSDNKITVTQQKFKSVENLFKTNSTNNSLVTKNILLEPVIEFITFGEQKAIKTNTIYFDLDSHEIRPDASVELNKVVGVLKKYPTLKIEVQSHTDSRAPDNYNLSLSERRANSSMNYIISQGIDPKRVVGKGYGETKLKNKCSNGIPCSNTEHELNRRTEFVIIENN